MCDKKKLVDTKAIKKVKANITFTSFFNIIGSLTIKA